MLYRSIDTTGFERRNEQLKRIVRYHKYKPMYYRTDLYLHSKRIVWLLEELIPYAVKVFPGFNVELARTMAAVHDDLEISLGDIMLGDKITFTKEQTAELYIKEQQAIEDVAAHYPDTFNGFRYRQLQQRYQMFEEYLHPDLGIMMDDPEACLIRYCDKMEGFCEALHEIYAGNPVFNRGHAPGIPGPIETYKKVFKEFPNKYTLFSRLKIFNHPLLQPPPDYNVEAIIAHGQPHTIKSIQKNTGYPHYDFWKRVSLRRGGVELLRRMTTKVE